ncbi:TetR family transcriptional regulator, partial [uncultured Sphingomonas sp.]|uniref:TetR family transcriptional regulator n=1 Tax=uncultured Sphingomonas sp. TaxID=158754 RepID=UPI0035CC91ED
ERTLLWTREQAATAARETSGLRAVRSFVRAHLSLQRDSYPTDAPRYALLSDMHSMSGDRRATLTAIYVEVVSLLRGGLRIADPQQALVATLVLLATVHWIPSWISGYADGDIPRAEARLLDILTTGLAGSPDWPSNAPPPEEPDLLDAQSRFLHAATTLINRDGYHGASVEKIAAELGVSTGSFYHHLDNKNELVVACFRRSFALIDHARIIGEEGGGTQGDQLARTAASLFRLQIEGLNPLLRTNAYQALPPPLRRRMLHRTEQMQRHFAGMIADGIAEGSIRAVDPLIASRIFISIINAAADVRDWPTGASLATSLAAYLSILTDGLWGRGGRHR